jgi:predicted metal-dependent phosphoesterase TrpH
MDRQSLVDVGREKLQIRIDLHVHSYYSYDSVITPKELEFYANRCGLDGVAITDHDKLDGALKIEKEVKLFIIPGMEISSAEGHVIALGVKEPIPRGLSADETVERIHEACGLAIACHPASIFKGSLRKHTSSKFDAVEVINASAVPFGLSTNRARQLATELGLGQVGGTDAHYGPEIGWAYTVIDSGLRSDLVTEAIRKGMCYPAGKAIPWRFRLEAQFQKRTKRFHPQNNSRAHSETG